MQHTCVAACCCKRPQDIGFTDLDSKVIDLYFHTHLPAAVRWLICCDLIQTKIGRLVHCDREVQELNGPKLSCVTVQASAQPVIARRGRSKQHWSYAPGSLTQHMCALSCVCAAPQARLAGEVATSPNNTHGDTFRCVRLWWPHTRLSVVHPRHHTQAHTNSTRTRLPTHHHTHRAGS
jgi:hypothetical protein